MIPFGGGTSVCGGVEAAGGDGCRAAWSRSTCGAWTASLEIDRREPRGAHRGRRPRAPRSRRQLRPHGLTLRHFPQSFEFSTLGGWIATRAGGHYATLHTHIDDFVESLRAVTPRGVIETRRLPGSGAGPAPDRLFIGSEGILGVITEAWMRAAGRARASAPRRALRFADMRRGAAARCARSRRPALVPANCRLLDAAEAASTGAATARTPSLVLGFESADHAARRLDRARARDLPRPRRQRPTRRPSARRGTRSDGDAAGAWRNAFLRMPYFATCSSRSA